MGALSRLDLTVGGAAHRFRDNPTRLSSPLPERN